MRGRSKGRTSPACRGADLHHPSQLDGVTQDAPRNACLEGCLGDDVDGMSEEILKIHQQPAEIE
jgi:hypothetical protein